jgi:hypothetical protein
MPLDYCNLQGPASLSISQAILEELSNRVQSLTLGANYGLLFGRKVSQIVSCPVAHKQVYVIPEHWRHFRAWLVK